MELAPLRGPERFGCCRENPAPATACSKGRRGWAWAKLPPTPRPQQMFSV